MVMKIATCKLIKLNQETKPVSLLNSLEQRVMHPTPHLGHRKGDGSSLSAEVFYRKLSVHQTIQQMPHKVDR